MYCFHILFLYDGLLTMSEYLSLIDYGVLLFSTSIVGYFNAMLQGSIKQSQNFHNMRGHRSFK